MIRPIGTRVLIEIVPEATVSKGGIYIPEVAQTFNQISEVLEIGPEVTTVKKGENVIFLRYGGSDIQYQNRKFRLLDETDVLGVVDDG